MKSPEFNQEIANSCIARFNCKGHEKLCSPLCGLAIDLRYQLELSGIPRRHQKFTIETLPEDTYALNAIKRFGTNLVQIVDSGKGMYIFGNVGVGKTTVATAIARTYIAQKSLELIRKGHNTKQLVQYVNVPDLLDLLKRGMDNEEIAEQGARVLENLKKCPLVIFDDVGAEKASEWSRERLLVAIGHRYDNELSTFFTSNLTIPELIEPLGGRLKSRIEGLTVPLNYQGQDRRKKL